MGTATVQHGNPYMLAPYLGLDDEPVRDNSGDTQPGRENTTGNNKPGTPATAGPAGSGRSTATTDQRRQETNMVDKATATVESLPGLHEVPTGKSPLTTVPDPIEEQASETTSQAADVPDPIEEQASETTSQAADVPDPQDAPASEAQTRRTARRKAARSDGPKRYTVDLDPEMWLWLKHTAMTKGVNASELIRAFLRQAMGDDDLVEQLINDVDNGHGDLLSAKNRPSSG